MQKEKLKEKYFRKHFANEEKHKRIAKAVIISGLVLGGLYLSKHLFNGLAGAVRGFKNMVRAWRE